MVILRSRERSPSSSCPASGELIGDAPRRRVEIISDDESLNATWSRFGPHSVGADLHVHHHHVDLFYVLEGELTVRLGMEDEPVAVPAGTLARVPPLVVHGFRNRSDADVPTSTSTRRGSASRTTCARCGTAASSPTTSTIRPRTAVGPRARRSSAVTEFLADRPGLRVALLADVEEIGISETWGDPDGPSPPPHLHRRHVESFYVLEGEMTFTAGGPRAARRRPARGCRSRPARRTCSRRRGRTRCGS